MDKDQWEAISRALRAPFEADQVEWRVQGKPNGDGRAQILAYIDARAVQDRLDSTVGAENWTFKWEPVAVVNGAVVVAKGILSIHGVPTEDVGDSGSIEPSKSAVSDALKRAAVQWGVGRYLYGLPVVWATLDEKGKIPAAFLEKLSNRLAQLAS